MIAEHWSERRFENQSQRSGDTRSAYQRDKARILHSAAFRRLQAKTQVLGIGTGDFHRTRLTHSLEASQIGHGIASQLAAKYPDLATELDLQPVLLEALCLAHDIGHPPFGHGGEVALHYMMRNNGGFEGNGQTFRIVSKLEPYTPANGMNLCRRSILGLIKYPGFIEQLTRTTVPDDIPDFRNIKADDWYPPKGLYSDDKEAFDWLLAPLSNNDKQRFMALKTDPKASAHGKTQFKSFDCSIMELADDIAYAIHDLEDAIVMGIVREKQFRQEIMEPLTAITDSWLGQNIQHLESKLFSQEHFERKDAIGALVNHFVTHISIEQTDPNFTEPLLRYNAVMPQSEEKALKVFKEFVLNRVIKKPEIQQLEYKGQQVVMELFTAFHSDPARLLPENTRKRWMLADTQGKGARVIADYISGMTDEFASRMYANLFLPKTQGVNHGQFY